MSRKDEDPSVVGARWAKSMKGGKNLGPQAERNPSDMAHQQTRDDGNTRGADAWSPSRAREALRRICSLGEIGASVVQDAERLRVFDSKERFALWCANRLDRLVTV